MLRSFRRQMYLKKNKFHLKSQLGTAWSIILFWWYISIFIFETWLHVPWRMHTLGFGSSSYKIRISSSTPHSYQITDDKKSVPIFIKRWGVFPTDLMEFRLRENMFFFYRRANCEVFDSITAEIHSNKCTYILRLRQLGESVGKRSYRLPNWGAGEWKKIQLWYSS